MNINVNIEEIEKLSYRLKVIGDKFVEMLLLFQLNSYDILSDLTINYDVELKNKMDFISKKIDDCYFNLKKHENYVHNVAQKYALTEREICKNIYYIKNEFFLIMQIIHIKIIY